jgi:hypothetical protein
MDSGITPEQLDERRRERQRAKIIAELERQANAQCAWQNKRSRYSFQEIVLVLLVALLTIAVSAGVLVAGKMVADSTVDQISLGAK